MKKTLHIAFALSFLLFVLIGCTQAPAQYSERYASLDAYPSVDITEYYAAENYTQPSALVDMTVKEVAAEIDAGNSLVVLCSYKDCPWCNAIITHLNDAALEAGIKIAHIDTRKDPAWQSNLDLLDYDVFLQYFGSALSEDEDGILHLYVPHLFFVKDSTVVYEHQGTVPSQENSSDPLSEEQIEEFRTQFADGLARL